MNGGRVEPQESVKTRQSLVRTSQQNRPWKDIYLAFAKATYLGCPRDPEHKPKLAVGLLDVLHAAVMSAEVCSHAQQQQLGQNRSATGCKPVRERALRKQRISRTQGTQTGDLARLQGARTHSLHHTRKSRRDRSSSQRALHRRASPSPPSASTRPRALKTLCMHMRSARARRCNRD